jgi:hypothetical protein
VPAGTAELTFRLLNFSVLRRIVRVNAGDIVTSDNTLTLSLKADVVVTRAATFRNIVDVRTRRTILSASPLPRVTAPSLRRSWKSVR